MLLSNKESNLSPGAPGWLRRRIMWPVFIGLMLATLVTAFVYISLLIHGSQQELAYNSAGMAAKWETDLYHHERTLNALGSGLSESQNLRLALQSRDRNRLIELVTPLFEFYKKHYSIDTLALIDHERRVVHRFHDAENHGDRVGFATIMAAEASGQAATGIDFGSNGRLVQRTVTPVYDQGRLLGYVVIGESMTVLLKHLDEAFVVRHMAVIDKAAIQQQKLVVKIAKDGKVQPIDIERFPAHVLIDQSVGTIPLSVQEKLQQGSLGTLNSGDIVSGAKYYYAVSKMPIRSGDETSLGFVLALRDITVQRQELINAVILASSIPFVVMAGLFIILYGVTSRTESRMNVAYRELQENREQVELGQKYWNDAFNAIKEPVFIHDAEFRVVRANQAYAQLAGMKIQEMIGRRYYHCYPKSDKPMPECVEALQSNLYDEDEHETTTPDGKIYLSRGFVTRNRQGHYLHSVHIMVDVSRDREKEKLVRDTAARLSSIMRAVPAGVGLLVNRVITYVNENVCVITGYKNEELVGQSSRVLYADDAEFERVGRQICCYSEIRNR